MLSCNGMTFYYAGLMRRLSFNEWPEPHACTYVVWDYTITHFPHVHDHDHYELLWVESGHGYHNINGEQLPLETGDFVLIRPEDYHSFCARPGGGGVRFINFAFQPETWDRIRDNFFPEKTRFFDRMPLEERQFHIGADERERLRLMAADLAAGRWTASNAAAFLHGTLALLDNLERGIPKGPALPDWLAHACRSIQQWPYFTGGVPEFVRLAGRSHEHVSRDCRRLLDASPRDIVNKARLKWAAMQLETTEKKIADIAEECGFDNLGHFYKCFREQNNVTPRRYRLQFGIRERE